MALLRPVVLLQNLHCCKEFGQIPWKTVSSVFIKKRLHPFACSGVSDQIQSLTTFPSCKRVSYEKKLVQRYLCSTVAIDKFPKVKRKWEGDDTQILTSMFDPSERTDKEWEEVILLMSQGEPGFSKVSCDALVMKRCLQASNYFIATSYIQYLENQGKEPNLATLSLYLRLCGQRVVDCGEEKVLELYYQLLRKAKVLDANLSESVILALTSTSQWKLALKHVANIRRMCNISTKVYSSIITAAFRNGDYNTGWHYLETMCQEEKMPTDSTLLEWITQCEKAEGVEQKQSMMVTLLDKLILYEIFPKVPVIESIANLFSKDLGWSNLYVKMSKSGKCPACNQQLHQLSISETEFKELQNEYVPRVLHGSDIFRSSSPEEWHKFQTFLEQRGPFSVVVDGLNVSYLAGKKPLSQRSVMLKHVVEKLCSTVRNGRILVIGRKHMREWSGVDFNAVKKMADVYTLDNLTKDDGFFIYAALRSGQGTKIVSSDMLRDHLYRLGDGSLREIFRRWQRQHQVLAVPSVGGVQLIEPESFSTTAQNQGTTVWHIPYDDGSPHATYQLPKTWLCTQANPHSSRRDPHSVIWERTVQSVPFTETDTEKVDYVANKSFRQLSITPRVYIGGKNPIGKYNSRKEPQTSYLSNARNVQYSKIYSYKKNSTKAKKLVVSDLFKE
ncbi:mitochondrial ribonuclease P catalytic subunit-like [Penaeus monodon]|uniref:mitochondrial ribonuclease P catalytic subunit-like n=1 Tax=Penaeus monodon TaxID=6687 RepID=UPI0018A792E9|nr:mitochondrial ribonuclease P catalytic subunit-like [Penaeus monodon]